MKISEIQITGVRNLQPATLKLGQTNIIYGANGSGKTSLLEAVSILGQARSFRSPKIQPVIAHGASSCTVFGQLKEEPGSGQQLTLGVKRERNGEFEGRVRGQPVSSTAQLAHVLPFLSIDAFSFDLLAGGPGVRRRFLDWGVFHVEHGFHQAWLDVRKALKQRNSLLRRGKIQTAELAPWSKLLATAAQALDDYRRDYVEKLRPCVQKILDELGTPVSFDLRYHRGWEEGKDLYDLLCQDIERDRARGFTQVGPQRAELKWRADGHKAADVFSRGQQKLAVIALKIAQGRLLQEFSGKTCVYLVDDLPAELDPAFLKALFTALTAMGAQILITCVNPDDLDHCWREMSVERPSMFHVEQGQINFQDAV